MMEKQLSEKLIEFFEEHPGEVFSMPELRKIMETTTRVLTEKLKKLIKHNEIEFEIISCRVARKLYNSNGLKRHIRLYFLE